MTTRGLFGVLVSSKGLIVGITGTNDLIARLLTIVSHDFQKGVHIFDISTVSSEYLGPCRQLIGVQVARFGLHGSVATQIVDLLIEWYIV